MNCTTTIALLNEPVVCYIQTIRYSQNLTISISLNPNTFNYTNMIELIGKWKYYFYLKIKEKLLFFNLNKGNKKTYINDFVQTENITVNSSIYNLTANENSFLLQTILFDDHYYLSGIEFNALKSGLITFGVGI